MRRAHLPALCLLALSLIGCQQEAQRPAARALASTPTPTSVAASPSSEASPSAVLTAYVVRGDARLRDGPGESGEVLRYLSVNETLTVLHPERGGPWYEVQSDPTRQRGWVHASVIRFKPGAVTPTPTPKPAATPTPQPSPTPEPEDEEEDDRTGGMYDVKVWVNTNSGVYHCSGTRWYGNTKEGEYMTQKEAIDSGNRPAYGKFCN
jgi:Bacterial SH3 domain